MEEKIISNYEEFLEGITKTSHVGSEADYLAEVASLTSAHPEADEPTEIGERIKQFRENKGLTLNDISQRTQIPVEILEQIEKNQISPPLGDLIKLGKALDMKMGYLISSGEKKPFTIVRKGMGKLISRHSSRQGKAYGYTYQMLAPDKTDRNMDPFFVILEPVDEVHQLSAHDGQEFILVLKGQMEVRLDDYIDVLGPGDSIYYDSTIPHLVRCKGDEPVNILAVIYSGS